MEHSIKLDRPERARAIFGLADRNLKIIRDSLGVQIFARGEQVKITGSSGNVKRAAGVIRRLEQMARDDGTISPQDIDQAIAIFAGDEEKPQQSLDVYVAGQRIMPKTPGQRRYIQALNACDMVFCAGPAGTGKTYLAVAYAVHMLKHHKARRLILVRPAVEAGEKLGFLPGDMQAKVNPYLRPLFDGLHDMMEYDQIRRFMVNDVIEVIPLAFMRGRTLNDSVIILDEAQNTTTAQMLMFLTRMGHGSKAIITGDDSQIDLPEDVTSGLLDAQQRLAKIKGIKLVRLDRGDIVRHRLVQQIVQAYTPEKNNSQGGA